MYLFLLFAFLAGPVYAQNETDTCAMATKTLHSRIGSVLVDESHRSGSALKNRAQVSQQKSVLMAQEVQAGKLKQAAFQGALGNLFASEQKFFTAYRYSLQLDPCTQMKDHIKKQITAIRNLIYQQCTNTGGNPYKKIKIDGKKMEWSSQYFAQDYLFLGSECLPKMDNAELFFMHSLANGFEVSEEQLCRAAWSGLKEVWNKTETCSFRNDWYDIKEWSKGNLVKRRPPSK